MKLNPNTLAGKFTLLLAATVVLSMATSWFLVSSYLEEQADSLIVSRLATDAKILDKILGVSGNSIDDAELGRWSALMGVRLTIMDTAGRVAADSEVPEDRLFKLDNHLSRPEVAAAAAGGFGIDKRHSESTRIPYVYYAVKSDTGVIIRCSLPMSRFYDVVSRVKRLIFLALALSGAIGLAAGSIGIGRITGPIRRLTEAAMKRGDASETAYPYPAGGSVEIDELSKALRESSKAAGMAMERLAHERNQLETIVRSAPCGLMLISAEGRVIAVNSAFSPLLRESGPSAKDSAAARAVRAPELVELIMSARDSVFKETSFSFRGAGDEKFYKARSVAAGEGILILLDDETEQKRDEDARKAFVADAGHELQTPLASISLASELLLEMAGSPGEGREESARYIKEIMRQRERMSVLVDDLLLLSRLESGVPLAVTADLDLSLIVHEETAQAKTAAAAKHTEWREDIENDIVIKGREGEIRRAVSNLLDNAVKYTARRYGDSEGSSISVKLKASGGSAVLSVTDNGVGIPGSAIGRIFGRFERAEPDRARLAGGKGGYGLGLSIVKRVVESHGGSVAAKSADELTKFVVTLPIAAPD